MELIEGYWYYKGYRMHDLFRMIDEASPKEPS